jgi:hypothetical protein
VCDRKVFCTLRYYRAKYPGMAYSLDDLASHFRIDQIIERYRAPPPLVVVAAACDCSCGGGA